jgi:hypothetical protein
MSGHSPSLLTMESLLQTAALVTQQSLSFRRVQRPQKTGNNTVKRQHPGMLQFAVVSYSKGKKAILQKPENTMGNKLF